MSIHSAHNIQTFTGTKYSNYMKLQFKALNYKKTQNNTLN